MSLVIRRIRLALDLARLKRDGRIAPPTRLVNAPEDIVLGHPVPNGLVISLADAAVKAVLRTDIGALDKPARQHLRFPALRLHLPRRGKDLTPKPLIRARQHLGKLVLVKVLRRHQRLVKRRHFSSW